MTPTACESGRGCHDGQNHNHKHEHNHHHHHHHHHHRQEQEVKQHNECHSHSHDHDHHHHSHQDESPNSHNHGGDDEKKFDCNACCDGHQDGKNNNDSILCMAVVSEDGTNISILDSSGNLRTFSYKGDIRKLCFSSHDQNVDDLLTACFDEDGNHGAPEESCFCGIETPHLHAHLHDPKTCNDDHNNDHGNHNHKSHKNNRNNNDLSYLARLTLHPTDDQGDEYIPLKDSFLEFPLSDRMPNECNCKQLSQENKRNISTCKKTCVKRRKFKVKHGDHMDYLVHNKKTGDVHLEHPCDCCSDEDYHGKLNCIGKRKLNDTGTKNVQLHFFEVPQCQFSIMNLFVPESSRVTTFRQEGLNPHAKKEKPSCCIGGKCTSPTSCDYSTTTAKEIPTLEHPLLAMADCDVDTKTGSTAMKPSNVVRSSFNCSKICCSSEVPIIYHTLDPMKGICKVMVNVPLKQVLVDHDYILVSAKDIENFLNVKHLGATITRDGGCSAVKNNNEKQTSGRSKFFVDRICCASEIPAIDSIVGPIHGVTKVSVNVTTKMVYVDHNSSIVVAQEICDALNKDGFGAHIEYDSGGEKMSASLFVTSKFSFGGNGNSKVDEDLLTSFLCTFDVNHIETFLIDNVAQQITVIHNPHVLSAQEAVQALLERTGIISTVLLDGGKNKEMDFICSLRNDNIRDEDDDGDEIEDQVAHLRPTVLLSGIFWIISMLSFIGDDWEYLKYVALLSVIFGVPTIAMKALSTLRRFQFDTNCLMLFAVLGAIALQEFTEAAAVTFLFAFSEWLEVRATTRARNALSSIVRLRPSSANLVHPTTKEIIKVTASVVPIGSLVCVRTGDKIPCDGIVVEGQSTVDESSLTGESRPVRKGPKDEVSGGTINCGSTQLMVRTMATTEDSAVSRLIRLVEEAQANRSETEKLVDEFARIYTPLVVFASLLMCTIPWAWGRDVGAQWTHNGLVLIVVACPCALIISTPVAYVAGLAATAQRGILIKGGAHLEALGMVKKICFDKTGTLTQGKFQLLHLNVIGEKLSRKEVLEYLYLMEERAQHPLAQAIVDGVKNEGITVPKRLFVKDHTFLAGEGVSGSINNLSVHVGNLRLFSRLNLLNGIPNKDKVLAEQWESTGGTVGFMSIEGYGIVCAFCVADAVRAESAQVVEQLKKMGICATMLTGDNNDAAQAIGNQVGLTSEGIRSQLLPEDKLSIISGMTENNAMSAATSRSLLSNFFTSPPELVLMCGDGVNDAPALAAADVGVAMGAGAALAMETADVTLLDSDLNKLIYSVTMGRRVIRKIKENVVFSIVVKFVVLGFAVAGMAHLWAAIASDVGTMILVTLNGMALLPVRKKNKSNNNLNHNGEGDIEEGETMLPTNNSNIGSSCQKGCCGSGNLQRDDDLVDNMHTKDSPTKDNGKSCKKGCCSSKIPEVHEPDKAKHGCKKGCCSSKSAKEIPREVNADEVVYA